ncbi:MAG TPA: permease prefix domain 1-containing protein [Planctomycetaceae bacterium]|nr:permease prefix domain 1-containing protein [Planctomycetaceae bacterium]
MPEHDFELYLSLLSRFLRLKLAQRVEIADELRDHLEERLKELAARGVPHDEAIRAALDEFGDAAELANHFTRVNHIRKRRLIMRYTFGTAAALAASLLLATAFWPQGQVSPLASRAIAQGVAKEGGKPTPAAVAPVGDKERSAVEAKLAKRIGKIDLGDMPLSDALEFLSDQIDVDILINRTSIQEAELATEKTVNLHVKRANLTARAALDLVLEPLGLSYTIRDGLIVVTTAAEANQVQVYNIRDLLPQTGAGAEGRASNGDEPGGSRMSAMMGRGGKARGKGGAMMSGMGMGGGAMGAPGMGGGAPGMMAGGGAAGGMGGGGGMGMGLGLGMIVRHTDSLADVIATTIEPGSWDSAGGTGSIVQYHELLVVKNSQTVHGKIKSLLEMMRQSSGGAVTGGAPARQSETEGSVSEDAK